MAEPVALVCLFPHSKDEFEAPQDLVRWLSLELRNNKGIYRAHKFRHVLDKNFISRVVKESIVLFRKGNVVVGQAEVQRGIQKLDPPLEELNEQGILTKYETDLVLVPNSITIFEPNKKVDQFEKIRGRPIPQNYNAIICTRKEFEQQL